MQLIKNFFLIYVYIYQGKLLKDRDTILEAPDKIVPQGSEELAGNAILHPLRLPNIYPDGLDLNPNLNPLQRSMFNVRSSPTFPLSQLYTFPIRP